VADDLRAGIKALLAQWGRDAAGYPGTEPGLYAAAAVRLCANEVRALLAAHPVQDEGTARAAFQEGYEFALIHLDDEPVQADLARLRPSHPVSAPGSCGNRPWRDANPGQVSQAGIGRTTRQGGRRE